MFPASGAFGRPFHGRAGPTIDAILRAARTVALMWARIGRSNEGAPLRERIEYAGINCLAILRAS